MFKTKILKMSKNKRKIEYILQVNVVSGNGQNISEYKIIHE